jgi:hypothetical protein
VLPHTSSLARPPLLQLDHFFVGHADGDVHVYQLPPTVLLSLLSTVSMMPYG